MSVPRYALYYVPEGLDPLYQLGSTILGYDVRAQAPVAESSDVREPLNHFDEAWTATSRSYGFHLTITESIDCALSTIPQVEREVSDLLGCFDPAHPFELHRHPEWPVGIWGAPGRHSVVLLYEANDTLKMLHTLVVARVNPRGTGSVFLRHYLEAPGSEQPHRAQQTRLFFSPTVLGNWYPHFTLLNPYTGDGVNEVASEIARLFEPYQHITIRSICLLIQLHDEGMWRIYREFPC